MDTSGTSTGGSEASVSGSAVDVRKRLRPNAPARPKPEFLVAFAGGPHITLFLLLSARHASKIARTSRDFSSWYAAHMIRATSLTVPHKCRIPDHVPGGFPRMHTLVTLPPKKVWYRGKRHLQPMATPLQTLLAFYSLETLHLQSTGPMSNFEVRLFAKLTCLRKLTIEHIDMFAPSSELEVGETLAVEINFLCALSSAKHLQHLACGLERVAREWTQFSQSVVKWWPEMKYISGLPTSGDKQIELVRGLKHLSSNLLTTWRPRMYIQTLSHWQPHVLDSLTTLYIHIPENERHAIDDKPYIDIGSIDMCPKLTKLDVKSVKPAAVWDPPKVEIRLTPPSKRSPTFLSEVIVTSCGFLTLKELYDFVELCPSVKLIEYKISCSYDNRPCRLPSDEEVSMLQRLRGIFILDNSVRVWDELALHAWENSYDAFIAFGFFRESDF